MSMRQWFTIMQERGEPARRLKDLMGLWLDTTLYYEPGTFQCIDPADFRIAVRSNAQRTSFNSISTSLLKTSKSKNNNLDPDRYFFKSLEQERLDYQMCHALARIFNEPLDQEHRQVVIYKFFYRYRTEKMMQLCNLSHRTYFRISKEAEHILIMEFGLDFYDESGIEYKNWWYIANNRRQWNHGKIRPKDKLDWPEYNWN